MVLNRLIRFIHWGIAFVVFFNLFVQDDGETLHRYFGYSAVLLVVIRFVYGLTTKNHRHFPNKMAQATYIAMWGCIIALGVTGFMMGTDKFWGDELIEEIHENLSKGIQVLVVMHLLGIAIDSFKFKRRTWMNMINGKKN